jgi:hypothetical protein
MFQGFFTSRLSLSVWSMLERLASKLRKRAGHKFRRAILLTPNPEQLYSERLIADIALQNILDAGSGIARQ